MNKRKPIKIVYRKLGRHKVDGIGVDGLAYKEDREIHIDSTVRGFPLLETLIHEIQHCQNPKCAEIKITGHAKELALLLWEQGFRKVELK
jgi:hypothetical protein